MRRHSAHHASGEAIRGARPHGADSTGDSRCLDCTSTLLLHRGNSPTGMAGIDSRAGPATCRMSTSRAISKKRTTPSEALTSESSPSSPHKLSSTCKQKRQTRRVDKAHGLAIDDNTTHAPVDQIIQPSAQCGHRGDVDISRWRQNRYVIPLIHTTMVPQKSSLDAHVSATAQISARSGVVTYDRPRKNSRETSAMSSSSADSVKRSSSPKTLPQMPDTPSPETESRRSRKALLAKERIRCGRGPQSFHPYT